AAEPGGAGTDRRHDRGPLLETHRAEPAGRRHSLFEDRHRRASGAGAVESADSFPGAAGTPADRVSAAPEVGAAVTRLFGEQVRLHGLRSRCCLPPAVCGLLLLAAFQPVHADTYSLIVSGLGGEPEYEQKFREQATTLAEAAHTLTGDA